MPQIYSSVNAKKSPDPGRSRDSIMKEYLKGNYFTNTF
jgi:hypothetical protein